MEINQDRLLLETSSPGKILVCGGYLIISPEFRGLVFNTSTYFNCKSFLLESNNNLTNTKSLTFEIISDKFKSITEYKAEISILNQTIKITLNPITCEENKFIQSSLIYGIYYFLIKNFTEEKIISNNLNDISLRIELNADYRFYSYSDKIDSNSIKTGLGSSSGLVCSLVSNIIYSLEKIYFNRTIMDHNKDKLNTLLACYHANNHAQNKVNHSLS